MITREIERVECADLLHKYAGDYEVLAKVVDGFRALHHKVVVTVGSWDLLHIGHVRYLTNAKKRGDVLVVGVDTDEVITKLKGELRPVVPYRERVEMLAYQSCVNVITPLNDIDESGNWRYGLLSRIKPDIFVAEATSYSDQQITDIQEHCGEVVVLPRQAEGTSTSQMIQDTVKKHIKVMYRLAIKR